MELAWLLLVLVYLARIVGQRLMVTAESVENRNQNTDKVHVFGFHQEKDQRLRQSQDKHATQFHGPRQKEASCQTAAADPNGRYHGPDLSAYLFESTSFPSDVRLRPSVGNGHVGTVCHGPYIHMNGLYNGAHTRSHRANIPTTVDVTIATTVPHLKLTPCYQLDAKRGIYREVFTSENVTLTQRLYAHRDLSAILVVEVEAELARPMVSDLVISLRVVPWANSSDINFYNSTTHQNVRYCAGHILEPETSSSGHTEVHIYHDVVPGQLRVRAGQTWVKWTFLTAVHVNPEVAWSMYTHASSLLKTGALSAQHIASWHDLWNAGRVDIEGNLQLAKMTAGCYYYHLSSVPSSDDPVWPFIGLSPSGLPWGHEGYHGHVFWDQETWMYPGLMLLHSDLGRRLIGTRKRTMAAARDNARLHGHRGLQYPWESAFTGVETCPDSLIAKEEIHISGDIALAVMQHYWATGNLSSFTRDRFSDIVLGVADFYVSRMTYNQQSHMYEIRGIIPPDEYHTNVSNNPYTNTLAQMTLRHAAWVANVTGRHVETDYAAIAERVYIPYDPDLRYHPEYDGYRPGVVVKQADTVLLGFPLMANMSTVVRRNDLFLYEGLTDVNGPAMTWTMFNVGWLELGQQDRAWANLQKTFANVANDFQVWTEVIHKQGAPNFLTGMGGFLQSMLFGYSGIRLRDTRLEINPVLPPGATMTVVGLDYQGSSLDLAFTMTTMMVTMTTRGPGAHALQLHLAGSGERLELRVNRPVSANRGKASISTMS